MTNPSTPSPAPLPFTGERYVPEQTGDIELEHAHRYAVAKQLARGKRILDLACGEGYGSWQLSETAASVVGIDVSEQAVTHAKARYSRPNLLFLSASAAILPLADQSFDLVVSFETIEHLHQQEEMLSEIRRVMTADGILFISSPNRLNYSDIPGYANPFHVKELYRQEFETLLKKHFNYVSLGGQNLAFGSLISPENSSSEASAVTSLTIGKFTPLYDLALASNSVDHALPASFLERKLGDSDQALRLLDRIHKLESIIQEMQAELDKTFASRSWAITKPLRAIQALTVRLFNQPPMNRILDLIKRAGVLFSPRTIRGGIDILRSGDLWFFASRLYEILIQTPPDVGDVFARSRTIEILTTKHTLYVAYLIQEHLAAAGIGSRILEKLDEQTAATMLHIVICPNAFKRLPRHMIAFQMEQTTSRRWFTRLYINVLRSKSIAILDYSLANIDYLTQHCRIPFQKIYYFPIGHSPAFRNRFLPASPSPDAAAGYDLVFYGAINDRRRKILDALQAHFRILILSECFGPALYEQLGHATAVLNIHYYQPALLETTRIHECFALGKHVISEPASNQAEYQPRLGKLIEFVDMSDTGHAVQAIRQTLDSIRTTADQAADDQACLNNTTGWSRFYFLRMLFGLQMIDYAPFESSLSDAPGAPLPEKFEAVCLSLPETHQRRSSAWTPDGLRLEYFDGIRHPISWVGCALSYKMLAAHALKNGVNRLLVYEDDVDPLRLDAATLAAVMAYLEKIDGQWDVFSGLITDLADSAVISLCHEENTLTFVHLSKMTGMVFNIYSANALRLLTEWTFESPETTPTIDRYLEAKSNFRVVTTHPFIAGHKGELTSTLWGFRNSSYQDWIARSQRRLEEKMAAWRTA